MLEPVFRPLRSVSLSQVYRWTTQKSIECYLTSRYQICFIDYPTPLLTIFSNKKSLMPNEELKKSFQTSEELRCKSFRWGFLGAGRRCLNI